jgi:hypothetical protein
MSQAGMVAHWRREGGPGAGKSIFVNGLGALATGTTVLVVAVAKFTEGAWITVVMIPGILGLMYSVERHYRKVHDEIKAQDPIDAKHLPPPVCVVTIPSWKKLGKAALQFAMTLTNDIKAHEYVIDPAHEGRSTVARTGGSKLAISVCRLANRRLCDHTREREPRQAGCYRDS